MGTGSSATNESVSLTISAARSSNDLLRVTLAALLRIHQINPSEMGDLSASIQEKTAEMIDSGSEVVIDYRIEANQVVVDLTGNGQTMRMGAPRR